MSEVRCPMCSEPNEADREVCEACGARLKPLVLDSTPPETEGGTSDRERLAGEGTESSEESAPDWLALVREQVERDRSLEEGARPRPEAGVDWLDRLRDAEDIESEEDTGPPGRVGPSDEEEISPQIGEPEVPRRPDDWLDRLRDREEEAAGEPEEEQAPPEERGLTEREQAQLLVAEDAGAAAPSAAEERGPRLPEEPEADSGESAVGEAAIEGDLEKLPSTVQKVPAAEDVPAPPWAISDQRKAVDEETVTAARLAEYETLNPPEEELPPRAEAPPRAPEEARAQPDDGLPHVPPLIIDYKAGGEAAEDVDLEEVDLPDWLSELKTIASEDERKARETKAEIERAQLPAWLEAMRPVEAFRAAREEGPGEKEVIESVGPLAGLSGVLSAEPIVAMPRAVAAAGTRLEVTERQFAQAEIIHRIVEEEQRAVSEVAPAKKKVPFVRMTIGIILFVAVALSVAVNLVGFSSPSRVDGSLMPLASMIDVLSTGRPGLVVVDYDPGYVGEIEAVAGQIVEQLMRKGVRLVTASTRTSGPLLADRMVGEIGAQLNLENGEHYLHLGYLPGGPAAIQLFASNPRQAVVRGFLLPEGFEGKSAWEVHWLQDVQYLSDFGIVVVVTADPETARAWIEQAQPWMGGTPLVMVVSAGVTPLVWPYYEAAEPRVQGVLSGLPSAVVYEQQVNGRPGAATARWDAFGMAVWTSFITLGIGGIMGLVQRVLRPGHQEETGA